jgi:hypothetical protein|tara:strand:- start:1316 stop:1480 length:165 start_codon:yes stop_codon:yes gene_type:complete
MKIKDTRKIKDFPVSTGNLRFPLDFQDTGKTKFSGVQKIAKQFLSMPKILDFCA